MLIHAFYMKLGTLQKIPTHSVHVQALFRPSGVCGDQEQGDQGLETDLRSVVGPMLGMQKVPTLILGISNYGWKILLTETLEGHCQ